MRFAGMCWILILLPDLAWAETAPSTNLDLASEIVRVVGFLVLLILLGMLATRWGKRWQPGAKTSAIRLLDGRNLAPGVGLRLVQVGNQTLLLGVTREHVSLVAEIHALDPDQQQVLRKDALQHAIQEACPAPNLPPPGPSSFQPGHLS